MLGLFWGFVSGSLCLEWYIRCMDVLVLLFLVFFFAGIGCEGFLLLVLFFFWFGVLFFFFCGFLDILFLSLYLFYCESFSPIRS